MFELLNRICFAQLPKTDNHIVCLVQKKDLSDAQANTRTKALKAHQNYASTARFSIPTDARSANQHDFITGICPTEASPLSVRNSFNPDANQSDDDSSIASDDFSLKGEYYLDDDSDHMDPLHMAKTPSELIDQQMALADDEMTKSINAALINLLPATGPFVIDYVAGSDMQLMCDHLLKSLCPRDSHMTFRLDLDDTFSGDAELPISGLFKNSPAECSGIHASNGESAAKGAFSPVEFKFALNALPLRLLQFKTEKGITGRIPLVLFKDSVRDVSELTKVAEAILHNSALNNLVQLRGVVSRFNFSSYDHSAGIPVFADKPNESHVIPLCSAFSKNLGEWGVDLLTGHDDFSFGSQNMRHNDVPVAFTQLKDILAQKFATNPEKIDAFLDGLKDTFSRYHAQLTQIEEGELPLRDPYDHNWA